MNNEITRQTNKDMEINIQHGIAVLWKNEDISGRFVFFFLPDERVSLVSSDLFKGPTEISSDLLGERTFILMHQHIKQRRVK